MKRIIIMLLIVCSAITTANAEQPTNLQKKPENVIAALNAVINRCGENEGQVFSVNRNPATGIIESSMKIVPFRCLSINDQNDFTQRNVALQNDQMMTAVARNFQKDEPLSYQFLHIQPGSNENFSLKVITDNGSSQGTQRIRTNKNQEMWFMCCKNSENPQLRDAYAIVWELSEDKRFLVGAVYMITSLRPDVYEKAVATNKKMFKIEGRVDENIKDSLYNIYIADSRDALYALDDHEYVACVPVVNKRFVFQTELERPCVGRLRCIFPDGSLCSAWIDLDFVPGETYHITVHDGYYDEDRDYERRVGRQSGKSMIEPETLKVVDEVPAEYMPATVAPRQDWRGSLSPKHQAQLELKTEIVQLNIERIKASYKSIGEELKGTRDQYKMDLVFDEIIKQNKELDKRYQDVIKQVNELQIPVTELPGMYKEILTFYNEQNLLISEIIKNYGAYTKSARKTQKYVNDLMEKYMNDMIKAME
jgi:hypothetical protein